MNDIEMNHVKQLAHDFATKHSARVLSCACMLHTIASDTGVQEGSPEYDAYARLAGRIEAEMPAMDEPRFSLHDYADAIANARQAVDPEKLLALGPDPFAESITWLATDKRETYAGRGHAQPPLRHDIFAGGTA